METIPSFALEIEKNDFLLSFYIKFGYRNFYLHPDIREFFLFHYAGNFYRCIALPFGWSLSSLCFTNIMRGFVQYVR